MNTHEPIKPEDYQEPRCVLCDPATGMPQGTSQIPMDRVVEKFDEYWDRRDYEGAERHLKYWLDEADFTGDLRGAFSLRNEMMGFYRKLDQKEKAFENATAALSLMREIGYEESISGGTCFVNCGTVYLQFGDAPKALEYFTKARQVYEAAEHIRSEMLGGLYNNMGLAYMDTAQYAQAGECYARALEVMAGVENGESDAAITLLNMADTAALEKGLGSAEEEIRGYLQRAKELLDTEGLPRDGYYAYVCGRCAPGFYCYGDDEYGAELEARAEKIYEKMKENA